MTNKRRAATLGSAIISIAMVVGCGGDGNNSTSYTTTSNVGDLSTWTIDGNSLTVTWQDIAAMTGVVEKTYNASAVCTEPHVTFGYRTCLVDGDAVCTSGSVACAPGDGPQDGETFRMFEVPGVALVVSSNDDELHAGFSAGACEAVPTDDYTFVNVGLGQNDIFGLFRTDAAFTTATHMDFSFSDGTNGQISYTTGDPMGVVTGLSSGPCSNGVRELTIMSTGETLRLMVTSAGHFVLDKSEGEGGLVAINENNAATISDFANRDFGGIVFPDNSAPQAINVLTGAESAGQVPMTSIVLSSDGDITPMGSTAFISNGATGTKLNETLLEPGNAYNTNAIVSGGDYTGGPSTLPGLFEISPVSGDETAILGIATAVGGKTILFGTVANEDGLSGENIVKGNFILVEK